MLNRRTFIGGTLAAGAGLLKAATWPPAGKLSKALPHVGIASVIGVDIPVDGDGSWVTVSTPEGISAVCYYDRLAGRLAAMKGLGP